MKSSMPAQIRTIVGLLLGALVVVGAMTAAGWWYAQRALVTFHWVDHTHRVLYELETTLAHAISVQSGARGFSLTGDEKYLSPYESGLIGVQQSTARLRELVADNQRQRGRLARLSSLVAEEVSVMQERLSARRSGGLLAASSATASGHGKRVVDAIRGLVRAMEDEERELLAARSSAARAAAWRTLVVVSGLAFAASGLIIAAIRAVRRVPVRWQQNQTA